MIVATVISALLLFGLVLADVLTDRALSRLPVANAVHIEVTGHQWWWEARYLPDGRHARLHPRQRTAHAGRAAGRRVARGCAT